MARVVVTRRRNEYMVITYPGDLASTTVMMLDQWKMAIQAPLGVSVVRGELAELINAAQKIS